MLSENASNQLGTTVYWNSKKQKWSKHACSNGKINKNNKKIFFFNFNILAVETCPNAPAACKKFCFSLKHENTYKETTKKQHKRNYNETKLDSFENNIIHEIEQQYNNKKKNVKDNFEIYIRIHQSGDFYNSLYFEKWIRITNRFKDYKNLHFMCYTKEIEMIDTYMKLHNITLDNLNIKIVFSIISNFKEGNTSQKTLQICKSLQNTLSKNALDTYNVYPNPSFFNPKNFLCQMSKTHNLNNITLWNKFNCINVKDKFNQPSYITDLSKNKNAPICANCLVCYNISCNSKNIDMEVF